MRLFLQPVLVKLSVMAKIGMATSIFLQGVVMPAQAQHSSGTHSSVINQVSGQWVPPDMDAIIQVEACAENPDLLCALLVGHAYENLSNRDALNPKPALQTRPLIGVSIIDGVRKTGKTRWKGGSLYDPRTGKSYYAKVQLVSDNALKITGCIGPGFCKGYVWTRLKPGQTLVPGNVVSESVASREIGYEPASESVM